MFKQLYCLVIIFFFTFKNNGKKLYNYFKSNYKLNYQTESLATNSPFSSDNVIPI